MNLLHKGSQRWGYIRLIKFGLSSILSKPLSILCEDSGEKRNRKHDSHILLYRESLVSKELEKPGCSNRLASCGNLTERAIFSSSNARLLVLRMITEMKLAFLVEEWLQFPGKRSSMAESTIEENVLEITALIQEAMDLSNP
jgi:hypothetical protein